MFISRFRLPLSQPPFEGAACQPDTGRAAEAAATIATATHSQSFQLSQPFQWPQEQLLQWPRYCNASHRRCTAILRVAYSRVSHSHCRPASQPLHADGMHFISHVSHCICTEKLSASVSRRRQAAMQLHISLRPFSCMETGRYSHF